MDEELKNESIKEVDKEKETEQTDKVESGKEVLKKPNIFKRAVGAVKDFGSTIAELNKIEKRFEADCDTYTIGSTKLFPDKIKAITIIGEKKLILRTHEKLLIGQVLTDYSCNRVIKIVDIDKKIFNYEVKIGNEKHEVTCQYAYYENYVAPIKLREPEIKNITTITNNNSLNNSGTIVGDINQTIVNDRLANLEKLENSLVKYKGKEAKEANKLFGNFKNCVINDKPNKSLFEKFLKALSFSAELISIAAVIIGSFL